MVLYGCYQVMHCKIYHCFSSICHSKILCHSQGICDGILIFAVSALTKQWVPLLSIASWVLSYCCYLYFKRDVTPVLQIHSVLQAMLRHCNTVSPMLALQQALCSCLLNTVALQVCNHQLLCSLE